jgi:hypothetical protein
VGALGLAWRARERPAGKESRAGEGEGDAWGLPEHEVAPGGTGAAVSGADGRRQRGRGQSRGAEQALEEEEEGKGSEGPSWNLQKPQGSHCKLNFPTNLKL